MKKITYGITVLAALALLAFTGTGCTAKAKKAYHLSRANRYYDAGKLQKAEIEYLNVLRYDQANSMAFARLGVIYYDEGRLQRALFFLNRGSQLQPDNTDLRLKMGFIYSSVGMAAQASAQAEAILQKNPKDAEAPLLLSESAMSLQSVQAVRKRLQGMAQTADTANIEVALGNLALRENNMSAASAAYHKAQSLDPHSPAVTAALAALAWAQNDMKQADSLFKAASDASPVRSPRRMQYVRFKMQTGDRDGARAAITQILKDAPDYIPANMALAEVAASEKKYDEGMAAVELILAEDADNFDALLFQAQLEMARGKPDKAVTDLERMAHIYPNIARVHYQLGAAAFANDDLAKAANSLNHALDLDTNLVEASLLLAEVQIQNKNLTPAIVSLENLRQQQPRLVQAQLLLADAYRAADRLGDALAIYQSLESAFPTNAQIAFIRGVTLAKVQDVSGARKEFERVLTLYPDHLGAIEQLVSLDLVQNQYDTARQRIAPEIQKFPKRPEFQILMAETYSAQTNLAQAEAILTKTIEMDPGNESAYLLLAQNYYDQGKNDQALTKVKTVLAKNPKNDQALMFAAKIYSAEKKYQDSADAYEQVLKIDPKSAAAINNLAYLYSENLPNLDRAYDLARQVVSMLDPKSTAAAAAADTLGWICFKKGMYDASQSYLQESASIIPDDAEIQYHLGMVLYMSGKESDAAAVLRRAMQLSANFQGRDECQLCLNILAINTAAADAAAQTLLEKRVSEKPNDPVAQLRLARIYERANENAKAITAYEAILQTLPRNLDATIALTRLYAATDVKKAYDMAKAANKISPYNPIVSHLLGRLAFDSGEYNLATSELQQALQLQPNDAGCQFDYAQAVYSIGRVAEAQGALQKAISLNLPAPQLERAKRMADLIALAATPAQAAAATDRIDSALKAEPNNVPALMARGVAYEAKGDMATAADNFEKVLDRYQNFTPAQKELARLYVTDTAKLERAYALAAKAHQNDSDDPSLTKLMGVIMVKRGDYGHAVTFLKQSALQLTSDAEVFYYLGSAQYHLKNRTESRSNLQQSLALKLSDPLANSAKQMLAELK